MSKVNNPRYPDQIIVEKQINLGSSYEPVFITVQTVDSTCRVELNRTFMNNNVLVSKYSLRMNKVDFETNLRLSDVIKCTIFDGLLEGTIIAIEQTNFQTLLWFNADYTTAFSAPTNDTIIAPTVVMSSIGSITTGGANFVGNITNLGNIAVTDHGFYYSSTNPNPTAADSVKSLGAATATGSFNSTITGLTDNKLYYVRSYATNYTGVSVSTVSTFTTVIAEPVVVPVIPTVSTDAAANIIETGATLSGSTSEASDLSVTAHGFVCSATETTPTIDNATVIDLGAQTTLGAFTTNFTGGSAVTTYYVRAYATNSVGTGYGSAVNFVTSAAAPVEDVVINQPVGETTSGSTTEYSVELTPATYGFMIYGSETVSGAAENMVYFGPAYDRTYLVDCYGFPTIYQEFIISSTTTVYISTYCNSGSITVDSFKIVRL